MDKRTPTGWLAWLVCALTLALIVCAVALAILNGTDVFSLLYLVAVALSALVGGVVATRRFANPVGWILLVGGAIFAFQEFSLEYAIYGLVTNPFSLPLVRTMGWLASWIYVPGLLLLLSFLPLYFPDGRLVSSRWRWVAGLALVLAVVGPISSAFLPSPTRVWDIVYPLGIVALGPVSDLLDEVATVLYCGVIFASAASLAVRFHRSVGEEREQIKWLAYAASALTAWLLIDPLIWVDSPILDEVVRPTMDGLLFAGIPVAVGVAVLKYRLYDIDLIINRTLVYGTLTGILALIYLGSVVLLQDFFHALTGQEGQSQLAIVLSTLAIAALFIPLRRRIQSFIDKRFYRSKYDAKKTLEAFSAKLRDETDIDALSDDLVEVVRETIQPTHVSLWLRSPRRAREHTEKATKAIEAPDLEIAPDDPVLAYLANASEVVEVDKLELDSPGLRAMRAADVKLVVPLVSQGELVGLLNLGPRLSQQEYSADDRKLLSDLSTQTAPAVRVAQLVRQHREAETRYRTLVEQTPAITYVQEPIESDNPKAVTYVSPQYETILGYPPESQVIDEEHWLRTIHPEDRERVLAEEARTDETGEPFKVEYRIIAADGRVVWVRDEATLVRDEEGEPLYWLGVQYDITEQKREVQERERIEQELRVARLIQQTLLPKRLPQLPGYHVAAYYQPASEVGGDFYDFFELEDGRLGLVMGDATGHGMPAAVLMASARSVLRAVAQRGGAAPGQALAEANEVLYHDIPPNMFVTCFYAILDPAEGRLRYANAGHNLPCCRHEGPATELGARGMPLGLMAGMHYEEKEALLALGECVLFYSDGLVEAHNPHGEMFGTRRLRSLLTEHPMGGIDLITILMEEMKRFTGKRWEQEDDITVVTLERSEEL
jgi:PAS domain S-box-containing protein